MEALRASIEAAKKGRSRAPRRRRGPGQEGWLTDPFVPGRPLKDLYRCRSLRGRRRAFRWRPLRPTISTLDDSSREFYEQCLTMINNML